MTARKTTSSRLRHKLTLQQEVQTADGAGGYAKSWSDVADVWAEIITITASKASGGSNEVLLGAQLQSQVTHRILLRYRDGVTAAMRLVFESRVFNIRTVASTGENRETLELLVQEGVGV